MFLCGRGDSGLVSCGVLTLCAEQPSLVAFATLAMMVRVVFSLLSPWMPLACMCAACVVVCLCVKMRE